MSKLPYMEFYVDDYDAATMHLSPEEDGIYFRLLRLAWRTPGCSLPDDAKWIERKMRLAGCFEHDIKPILQEFFKLRRGRWSQKKQRAIYCKAKANIRGKTKRARAGGVAKSLKYNDSEAAKQGAKPVLESAKALPTRTRTIEEINNKDFPVGSIAYTDWGKIAKTEDGKWDVDIIANAFRFWAAGKELRPENMVRSFTTFCRNYSKRNGRP